MLSEKLGISIYHVCKRNNISCDEVGDILVSLKKVIDSLTLGSKCEKKVIPNNIKNNNPLFFDSHIRDPFTVFIASEPDLVGRDREETTFYLFLDIVKIINKPEKIISSIQDYNLIARKSFRTFIEIFVKNGLYFSLQVQGIHGEESITITIDKLREALDLMSKHNVEHSEQFEYKGELVGINVKNDFFAFMSEEEILIRGKLSKSMKNQNFKIPSFIIATINEQEQINELTKEKKKNYTLEKISTV